MEGLVCLYPGILLSLVGSTSEYLLNPYKSLFQFWPFQFLRIVLKVFFMEGLVCLIPGTLLSLVGWQKMNNPLPTKIFITTFVISKDCFQSCLFKVRFHILLIIAKANLSLISYWLVLPHKARLSQPLAAPFPRFASPKPTSSLAPT